MLAILEDSSSRIPREFFAHDESVKTARLVHKEFARNPRENNFDPYKELAATCVVDKLKTQNEVLMTLIVEWPARGGEGRRAGGISTTDSFE